MTAKKILNQLHFSLIIFFCCHGLGVTVLRNFTDDDKAISISALISFLTATVLFIYDVVKANLNSRRPESSDILDDIFLREKEMKRETITFEDKQVLCDILNGNSNDEYELVQNEITNSDPEDGGADHDAVIQRKSDGKYFAVHYTDWDEWYNFDRDFPSSATEVFAKKVEVLVFE